MKVLYYTDALYLAFSYLNNTQSAVALRNHHRDQWLVKPKNDCEQNDRRSAAQRVRSTFYFGRLFPSYHMSVAFMWK